MKALTLACALVLIVVPAATGGDRTTERSMSAERSMSDAARRLNLGDGFQYAFGHFETFGGEVLEGRGVTPHAALAPTREALLRGRDPALDAAVDWILSTRGKE